MSDMKVLSPESTPWKLTFEPKDTDAVNQLSTEALSPEAMEAMEVLRQDLAQLISEKSASSNSPLLSPGKAAANRELPGVAMDLILQNQDVVKASINTLLDLTEATQVTSISGAIVALAQHMSSQLHQINGHNADQAGTSPVKAIPGSIEAAVGVIIYALLSPQTVENKTIAQQGTTAQTQSVDQETKDWMKKNDPELKILDGLLNKLKDIPGNSDDKVVASNISEQDFKILTDHLKTAGTSGAEDIGTFTAESGSGGAIVLKSDASVLVWTEAVDSLQQARTDSFESQGKLIVAQANTSKEVQKSQIAAATNSTIGNIVGAVANITLESLSTAKDIKANTASSKAIDQKQGTLAELGEQKAALTKRLDDHNATADRLDDHREVEYGLKEQHRFIDAQTQDVHTVHEQQQLKIDSKHLHAKVVGAGGHLAEAVATSAGGAAAAQEKANETAAETAKSLFEQSKQLAEQFTKTYDDMIQFMSDSMEKEIESKQAVMASVSNNV